MRCNQYIKFVTFAFWSTALWEFSNSFQSNIDCSPQRRKPWYQWMETLSPCFLDQTQQGSLSCTFQFSHITTHNRGGRPCPGFSGGRLSIDMAKALGEWITEINAESTFPFYIYLISFLEKQNPWFKERRHWTYLLCLYSTHSCSSQHSPRHLPLPQHSFPLSKYFSLRRAETWHTYGSFNCSITYWIILSNTYYVSCLTPGLWGYKNNSL